MRVRIFLSRVITSTDSLSQYRRVLQAVQGYSLQT
ncbi:hypothetical protein ANA_P10044 (plasmid) [Anabaena sp. 90]|nr:hypothetical protein ANA_P10044 [Anabaena sp. 90]